MPKVIKIGSQTSGADGNITYFMLSQDIQSGFSNLGVYYPNSDSTQRIGIVPDSVVTLTIAGIMQGRDEVLEKALQVGCQIASVPKINTNKPAVSVFPNPATDALTIKVPDLNEESVTINLADITGRILIQKSIKGNQGFSVSFNIKALATGMYFVTVKTGTQQYVTKIVKE